MEGKNPNETILIPLLNKRVSELTTTNILIEAKLLYAEEEKKELQDALEAEKARFAAAIEGEKAQMAQSVQEQTGIVREACERDKQTIAQNWQNELSVQTGNLKGQIAGLSDQLAAANAQISALQAELAHIKPVPAPVEEKPSPKRRNKADAAMMGGGTF
jgi:chromosome segregation ATPase